MALRPDGLVRVLAPGSLLLVDRRAGPVGSPLQLSGIVDGRLREDGTLLALTSSGDVLLLDAESSAVVDQTLPLDGAAEVTIANGMAAYVTLPRTSPVVVDLSTGERTTRELATPDGRRFEAVLAYPSSSGLWAIDNSNTLTRWEDDNLVERLDIGGVPLTGQIDGDRLASIATSTDATRVVHLVDLEAGNARVLLTIDSPSVAAVHPAPADAIYAVDRNGVLHHYDASGALVTEIETGVVEPRVLALDGVSGRLAIGGATGTVALVDPNTGDVEELTAVGSTAGLGFVGDGQLLAIIDLNGRVRLWDVVRGTSAGTIWSGTGARLMAPVWYDQDADSVWLSTSGRLIEVSLDPQDWIARACEVVGRDLTPTEWDRLVPGDAELRSICN